jgi:hypothetical protein
MLEEVETTGFGRCSVVNYTRHAEPFLNRFSVVPVVNRGYSIPRITHFKWTLEATFFERCECSKLPGCHDPGFTPHQPAKERRVTKTQAACTRPGLGLKRRRDEMEGRAEASTRRPLPITDTPRPAPRVQVKSEDCKPPAAAPRHPLPTPTPQPEMITSTPIKRSPDFVQVQPQEIGGTTGDPSSGDAHGGGGGNGKCQGVEGEGVMTDVMAAAALSLSLWHCGAWAADSLGTRMVCT